MLQLLPSISARDYRSGRNESDVEVAVAELNELLHLRAKLTGDIAQIRKSLKSRIAEDANSRREKAKSRGNLSTRTSISPDLRGHPVAKPRARRPRVKIWSKRPRRWELERACRVALIESDGELVSVEELYDHIQRRGSVTFEGYRRPFRALRLALNALVRRNEASVSKDGRDLRWRWAMERMSLQPPAPRTYDRSESPRKCQQELAGTRPHL
jgi:hypothetical protein